MGAEARWIRYGVRAGVTGLAGGRRPARAPTGHRPVRGPLPALRVSPATTAIDLTCCPAVPGPAPRAAHRGAHVTVGWPPGISASRMVRTQASTGFPRDAPRDAPAGRRCVTRPRGDSPRDRSGGISDRDRPELRPAVHGPTPPHRSPRHATCPTESHRATAALAQGRARTLLGFMDGYGRSPASWRETPPRGVSSGPGAPRPGPGMSPLTAARSRVAACPRAARHRRRRGHGACGRVGARATPGTVGRAAGPCGDGFGRRGGFARGEDGRGVKARKSSGS